MLHLNSSLFLVLACLTVLCAGTQRSLSIEEENLEKGIVEHEVKQSHVWLKKYAKKIAELGADALASIPTVGPTVSAIAKMPLKLIPEEDKLDMIQSEMAALNTRLDIFYEELKWASNDFQKVFNNIEQAWLKYQQMERNDNALKSTFCPFYSPYADSVSILHKLISKPEKGEQSLADVLAKKLRCHEKHVEAKFLYLRQLVSNGNKMVQKCYEVMGVDKSLIPNSAQMLLDSNLALFKAQQSCVSNSELYIKRDILERINDEIVHEDIAKNILDFLKDKYDRYDWLVVAFTTHFSKDLPKFLTSHIFSGFTGVERGSVTVAVARQVSGSRAQTEQVIKTIKKEFTDVPCNGVEKKLKDLNLMDAITAVHVYQRPQKAKNGNGKQMENPGNEQEEEEEEMVEIVTGQGKYITSGECKRIEGIGKPGSYTIMIKSDEERAMITMDDKSVKKKLCPNGFCKKEGTCEVAPRTKIPMCLCKDLFYGKQCEEEIQPIAHF